MTIKILEVVPYWPAEVFIQRHISSFLEKPLSLQIVTKNYDYSLQSSSITSIIDTPVIELPRLHESKFTRLNKYIFPNLNRSRKIFQRKLLIDFFNKENPDVIHFHWASLAIDLFWIPLELKIPFTFSLRGYDVRNLLFDDAYKISFISAITSSVGAHSVCDYIWKQAKMFCDFKEVDIFHKTIYTTVPISSKPRTLKKHYGPFIFVSVGRLNWTKNYINLLIAFKQLLSHGLPCKLLIVGDGDLKECLVYWTETLKISEFVTFTGTLSYSEIRCLLETADGYIQSSIAEGLSNSLAEAMAIGIPVFATSVGGTPEIIREGINGFLLDVEHPENWWEKFIIVENQNEMEKIAEQAWVDARTLFSAQTHYVNFINFYNESISKKK